jgi:predicted nuclease of restriction endonuclease-like RecB superfamily
VRFSLQDVKKSVHRRAGMLTLSLHFLREGELLPEIERLISYYERLLGCPQGQFAPDEARACIGDYRLANCIIATLSHWYNWQAPDWQQAIQQLDHGDTLLAYTAPMHLRQALYTYVNEQYHGFLDAAIRPLALQHFAAQYHLTPAEIEALLSLDSDEQAHLVRNTAEAPRPENVARLYNQWAFEAALGSSSEVHFTIDCTAFTSTQTRHRRGPTTGIGSIIKRLCTLSRHFGVYYDLAYGHTQRNEQLPGKLLLTLYGPQEVTGAPQQYGLRLARLCRSLLGYGTTKEHIGKHLINAIVEASATVHFLQRTYQFVITEHLLRLLPVAETTSQGDHHQGDHKGCPYNDTAHPRGRPDSIFDSGIEQQFADAFSALSASDGVDGWMLEREPEPLLLDHSIFIPDFALTRAQRRIYVEILGFWTPAYRERKIQKLQQLQERDDVLLAIPVEAKEAFIPILSSFPVVWYQGQLSAREVVQMLRHRYDDFAARLIQIDYAAVRTEVQQQGIVTEAACYTLLHCYRRSELQQVVQRVIGDDDTIRFLPGAGLYHRSWAEQVQQACTAYLQHISPQATLDDLVEIVREQWPDPDQCSTAALETLLTTWPTMRISHDSIFSTTVELAHAAAHEEASLPPPVELSPSPRGKKRPAAKKKHIVPLAQQDGLWE